MLLKRIKNGKKKICSKNGKKKIYLLLFIKSRIFFNKYCSNESDQQRWNQLSQVYEKIQTTITSSANPSTLRRALYGVSRYGKLRRSFTRDLCRHLVDLEIASKDAEVLARQRSARFLLPKGASSRCSPITSREKSVPAEVHNTSRECNERVRPSSNAPRGCIDRRFPTYPPL